MSQNKESKNAINSLISQPNSSTDFKDTTLLSRWSKNTDIDDSVNLIEEREYGKDYLSEAVSKAGLKLASYDFVDLLDYEITEIQLQCLYIVCAYTVNNYFGVAGPISEEPDQITLFLNQLFPMGVKERDKYFRTASSIHPPPYSLTVHLIEAANLLGCDADNLSDPFCLLTLYGRKQVTKVTDVREHTVDPVWDQVFHFDLGDLKTDVLVLEIYDKDPQGVVANLGQMTRVKSGRGCWNFCRDFFKKGILSGTDDFLGKTQINIAELYAEGIDKWIDLLDNNGEKAKGHLHVKTKIAVKRPKNTLDALKRHFLLLRQCLALGINEKGTKNDFSIFQWEQILSLEAQTLIFQHGVQGNIYYLEDLICRFIVVISFVVKHESFKYSFLYSVLYETNIGLRKFKPPNFLLDFTLYDLYYKAVDDLQKFCFELFRKIHSLDITDDAQKAEFGYVLRCISLCQDITGSGVGLWSPWKAEAQVWYSRKAAEITDTQIERQAEIISNFLVFLKKYHVVLDEIVAEVFTGKTYSLVVYEIIESTLGETLRERISEIASTSRYKKYDQQTKKIEDVLTLFKSLKELIDYLCDILPDKNLQVEKFRDWFGADVTKDWFRWKQDIIIAQIELIVSDDDLENKYIEIAGRQEKQSISAKHASELMDKELRSLWQLVSHPEYIIFDDFLVWGLHICCMEYVGALVSLIHSRKIVETFKSGGLRKLCAIANDIWSMAIFAGKLLSETVQTLHEDLPDTKLSLKMLCSVICGDICEELAPEITKHIDKVAMSYKHREQVRRVRAYVRFMKNLLKTRTGDHMCFEVHLLFFNAVWGRVVGRTTLWKNAKPQVDTCLSKLRSLMAKSANIYDGLRAVLKETEKLWYMDRKGRLKDVLWTEDYERLRSELEDLALNNRKK